MCIIDGITIDHIYEQNSSPMTTLHVAARGAEDPTPRSYRLVKKPDNTLVLQGEFVCTQRWGHYGSEWRDIPTIIEEA